MLKIKDNVDLKELEKLGFDKNAYKHNKKIEEKICFELLEKAAKDSPIKDIEGYRWSYKI